MNERDDLAEIRRAVRARQEPERDDLGIGEVEPPRRGLDRVDVTDQVGHGHVGRRELLLVASAPVDPADRKVATGFSGELHRRHRHRPVGILVQLRSVDRRQPLVEEPRPGRFDPELARSLGKLPERLIVYGIEAKQFDPGADLSEEARKGVDEVVQRIEEELGA